MRLWMAIMIDYFIVRSELTIAYLPRPFCCHLFAESFVLLSCLI